jgi:MFS family permease
MGTEKIEFYKSRNVGDVLSASADFLRQNWKILYKNILIIGAPLAILQGIFLNNYTTTAKTLALGGGTASFALNALLFFAIAIVLSLFVYSITATMINRYGEGTLTENTKWGDLKDSVYNFAGKTFVIGLLLTLAVFVFVFLVALILSGLGLFDSMTGSFLIMFIIFVLILAFIPGLVLVFYPAYYNEYSSWKSLKTGLSLGLRHWGSTFLVLLVAGIITAVFSGILAGGYQVWSLLSATLQLGFVGEIIAYVLAVIAAFATLLATPITIVFLSFQYFSIVEKEDGVSVQEGIDDFDNL